MRKYRQFVYETGAVGASKGKVIDKVILRRPGKKASKFSGRTGSGTDAGILLILALSVAKTLSRLNRKFP